jgi:hypothetical protein
MTLPAITPKRLGLFIVLASAVAVTLVYFADPGQHSDGTRPSPTALQNAALFVSLVLLAAIVWAIKILLFRAWR